MPSIAKTTPLSGCISAKSGHRSAHWARTAESEVKACGITPERASSTTANTVPTPIESQIIRTLAA